MAKKKLNKQIREKDSCNQKNCCGRMSYCGGKDASQSALGIVLNIKNLHLHFDEHMESENFYHSGYCDCDADDSVVVDMDELSEQVSGQTGVDVDTVRKVLAAETEIMEKLGICEAADQEELSAVDEEPEVLKDTVPTEESEG